MTRLAECPGRDLWYEVRLGFDAPHPLRAEVMSVWLGVPDPTRDICDWVPSGQFTGPYPGSRVPAPGTAGEATATADGKDETSGANPAGESAAPADPVAAFAELLAYASETDRGGSCRPICQVIEQQMQAMTSSLAALNQIAAAGAGVVDTGAVQQQRQAMRSGYLKSVEGLSAELRRCLKAAGLSPP
jgi:hypothetical protein